MIEKDIRDEIIEAQNKIIKLLARNIHDEKVYLEHLKLEEELKIIDLYEEYNKQYKNQQSLTWEELVKIAVEEYGFTYAAVGGLSYDSNGNHIEIKPSGDIYINHDWQKRLTIPISKNRTPYQQLQFIKLLLDEKKEK